MGKIDTTDIGRILVQKVPFVYNKRQLAVKIGFLVSSYRRKPFSKYLISIQKFVVNENLAHHKLRYEK